MRSNPNRLPALDIAFRKHGHRRDRSVCEALQHTLQLLGADRDEHLAALALLAIVSAPLLPDAIVASACPSDPLPPVRASQDAAAEGARRPASVGAGPAGGRTLIDLHIALERAWDELGIADEVRNGPRWEQAMSEARTNINRIEAEIADVERGLLHA